MNILNKLRRAFPKRSRRLARRETSLKSLAHVACVEQLELRTMLSVDYVLAADSLDQQMVTMQNRLTDALSFFQTGATSSIPIVGDQLGQAAIIVPRPCSQPKARARARTRLRAEACPW